MVNFSNHKILILGLEQCSGASRYRVGARKRRQQQSRLCITFYNDEEW